MIKVLRPFCMESTDPNTKVSALMSGNLSPKDAKAKKHALELELIKMQQEVLELELKYGPLNIDLPDDDAPANAANVSTTAAATDKSLSKADLNDTDTAAATGGGGGGD